MAARTGRRTRFAPGCHQKGPRGRSASGGRGGTLSYRRRRPPKHEPGPPRRRLRTPLPPASPPPSSPPSTVGSPRRRGILPSSSSPPRAQGGRAVAASTQGESTRWLHEGAVEGLGGRAYPDPTPSSSPSTLRRRRLPYVAAAYPTGAPGSPNAVAGDLAAAAISPPHPTPWPRHAT
jgi:hypothetical protein